jgi:hypothetical protein
MNTTKLLRSKSFLIALFSAALPALAQSPGSFDNQELAKRVEQLYGVPSSVVLRNPEPGDASSGVEVARTNDALFIDPTPCLHNQQKRIFKFVKPYRESKISDAKCDGKTFQQVQVIQQ